MKRATLFFAVVVALALAGNPVCAAPPCYFGFGAVTSTFNLGPGAAFSYQLPMIMYNTDPCEFTYNFELTAAPSGMTITSDGLIPSWLPPQVNATYDVTVRLTVDYTLPTVRTVVTQKTFTIDVCVKADVRVHATYNNTSGFALIAQVDNLDGLCAVTTAGELWVHLVTGADVRVGSWSGRVIPPGASVTVLTVPYSCGGWSWETVILTSSSLPDNNPANNSDQEQNRACP